MATALQCPACGFRHRLSSLEATPTFRCSSCGRLLKTPPEYVRAQPVMAGAPAVPDSGTVRRGGAAARDRTAVLPTASPAASPGAAMGTTTPAAAPRTPTGAARAVPPGPLPLPLRVLAWIVAVALGGYSTLTVARGIGWLSGDRIIDVLTGNGVGRYLRLFSVVPVWALVSAAIATGLIEGGRMLAARRAGFARPPRAPRPPRAVPSRAGSSTSAGPSVRPPDGDGRADAPTRRPRPPETAERPRRVPPAADARPSPSRGEAGEPQRPRRIPRRGTTS